jgi:small subunit ribosomal protein S5
MADETNLQGEATAASNRPVVSSEGRGRGRGRGGERGERGERGGRGRRDDRRGRNNNDEEQGEELIEKLVHINRVSKTVKGGKRFGFAALVVVGDGKGRVGFGHGKAREVPEAITKATASAKKKIRVPLEGRTLHHDGKGRFGAGKVNVRSAPAGTGIIAGGPMRAVFESLGVHDVVTKSVGTSNPYNMIRATFDALTDQTSPKSVAQRRGKKVADLLGRGGASQVEAEAAAEAIAE